MVEFQLPKLITRVRFPSLAPGILLLLLIGCVAVEKSASGVSVEEPMTLPAGAVKPTGVYHKVQKGETIWRISQAYNVGINDIISSNKIPNGAVIEENQLILIPGARRVKEVAASGPAAAQDDNTFIWPIKGKVVSYFGDLKASYLNRGIGIEAPEGEMIQAARRGKVVFSDYLNGYGHTVIVDHQDNLFSIYSQNQENLVKVGDDVSRGDPIGKVGRKGKLSMLHFEIRKKAAADNPLYYLP